MRAALNRIALNPDRTRVIPTGFYYCDKHDLYHVTANVTRVGTG